MDQNRIKMNKSFLYRISLSIVTLLIVTSCSIPTPKTVYKETFVIDYSRYNKQGFYITESNSVSFDYEPVGSVITVLKGLNNLTQVEVHNEYSDTDAQLSVRTNREPKTKMKSVNNKYTIYDAIDEFATKCKDIRANGVINFKINYTFDTVYGTGYEISGMAIKK